jgi:serine/threonine protein phosphatase 1
MCIYAVGDIHGRLDLLLRMYEGIAAHRNEHSPSDWRIIHLGDNVDRGPGSKGVLDFLIAQSRDPRVICLAGNHDVCFLDFLAEPDPDGPFANNGGRQTALSYGVDLDFLDAAAFPSQFEAFRRAVPDAHRQFIEGLRLSSEFGDFFFCHAGIAPDVALDRQEPQDLIWIRNKFLNHEGLYAKVIVHGHTPTREPEVRPNRVNVDTGAFASGVLTALVIEGGNKQLMQVAGRG